MQILQCGYGQKMRGGGGGGGASILLETNVLARNAIGLHMSEFT